MKNKLIYIFVIFMAFIGCNQNAETNVDANLQGEPSLRKIEVAEHMNGGGYTFIRGNENGKEIWIAVREMPVEVGEVLYFNDAMVMNNFESKSLNKTFESILFVNDVSKNSGNTSGVESNPHGEMPGMMSPSAAGHSKPEVKEVADVNVEPLADGITVEMVNNQKSSLAGKIVKVRGIVTKYNGGIMNKNWIHIQDGTGSGKTADLTITSDKQTKVGETIVIEGKVSIDKDFGAGYFYEVIVEEANITVEEKI